MKLEYEVRLLNHAAEFIENLVTGSICTFIKGDVGKISTVFPNDLSSKKLFFILLMELFLPVNQEIIPEKSQSDSLLTLLKEISRFPQFLEGSSQISRLKIATEEYINWLTYKFDYNLDSNIGSKVSLRFSREEALYLIGNRCKHTLFRSNTILKRLVKLYQANGIVLDPKNESLILVDIDIWFFDHFGGYHFTKICELSSNIYHGILEYMQPVYQTCIEIHDNKSYSYKMPPDLNSFASMSEFYDLLNRVRNPYMHQIETDRYLQLRY